MTLKRVVWRFIKEGGRGFIAFLKNINDPNLKKECRGKTVTVISGRTLILIVEVTGRGGLKRVLMILFILMGSV